MTFGDYLRERREALRRADRRFSVRQVAQRIGVEPAYLSKIERNEVAPPSEEKVRALAADLGEDPDVLLALAGKVSSDLLAIERRNVGSGDANGRGWGVMRRRVVSGA